MNRILILIEDGIMTFSITNKKISEKNLNNTNLIDVSNLKFSEQYILSNLELVSTFLSVILMKQNINKVCIKNSEISETVIKLILPIKNINSVVFSYDTTLSYTECSLLAENTNLEYIDCFSIPSIMYYKFKNGVVNTRCEILFNSNFMIDNNINTYSDLFKKSKIVILKDLEADDINDLKYFLENNKIIKKIEIYYYKQNNLKLILELINSIKKSGISITIFESSDNNKDLLNDINIITKLQKKHNIKIKIKYSKEYKEKNGIKQLNIFMIRYIVLGVIIIFLIFIILVNYNKNKNLEDTSDNMEMINNVISEVANEVGLVEVNEEDLVLEEVSEEEKEDKPVYVSPYYLTYEKTYQKLLEINNDTVGWLTVKNTNIDYPVVKTSDNNYYLNNSFKKTKNNAGWIFVDYRNRLDGSDKNIIIYGHNVRGSNIMFSTLKNVIDKNWYNNSDNLNIIFNIKDEAITWKVFSIYTIKNTNDYIQTEFTNNSKYLKFLNTLKDRSIKDFNVELNSNDQILTLSSCYKDSSHRLVIHAKRV